MFVAKLAKHDNSGRSCETPRYSKIQIADAIGAVIIATVLGSHTGASGVPSEHGWVVAFAALSVAAAASAGTCLLIPAHLPNSRVGSFRSTTNPY